MPGHLHVHMSFTPSFTPSFLLFLTWRWSHCIQAQHRVPVAQAAANAAGIRQLEQSDIRTVAGHRQPLRLTSLENHTAAAAAAATIALRCWTCIQGSTAAAAAAIVQEGKGRDLIMVANQLPGQRKVWGAVSSSSSLVNSNVVALGGSDKVLRIWDSRAVKGEALAVRAYAAHEGWISSLAWRPSSSFHVASGSHDGTVKLWDIRTAVPLGSLQQHSDAKVLCVGWWGKEVLVSGGADCKLQLYDLP